MKTKTINKHGGSEIEKMQYNPLNLGKEMMWEKYPYFKRRPIYYDPQSIQTSTLSEKEWNDVVRYIVLFVDNQSPYASERDFELRKELCISILEIEKSSAVFGFIQQEKDLFKTLMFNYFKDIKSHKYKLWFSKLNSINNYYRLLMENDNEDNIDKRTKTTLDINKVLDQLNQEIISLEADLFKDERTKDIIQEKAEEEELFGYPERFAQGKI